MAFRQSSSRSRPGAALERRRHHAADLALAHQAHLIGISVIEPTVPKLMSH